MRPVRRTLRWTSACAVIVLFASHAGAETSPWSYGAALGLSHDSNVYRLPDSAAALPGDQSRADTVTTATVLAGLDQPIGRQRVFGNASLRDIRFAHNSALNNNGYGLNLGLDWSTAERLSGRLSLQANRDQALYNPDKDLPTVLRSNSVRSEQIEAIVRLGAVSTWLLEGALGWRQSAQSAPQYRALDVHQATATMGLRWQPRGTLSLATSLRLADGRYPHYRRLADGSDQADRFRRQELNLNADWAASGASTLALRLGATHMAFTEATQRNFNGLTGELRWAWRPRAKLALTGTLARDTSADAALSAGIISSSLQSRASNTLRVQADYELSAKINLQATLSTVQRDLASSATIFGSAALTAGSDRANSLGLAARWAPTRTLQLRCEFNHDRRRSDGRLSLAYGANNLGCTGQILIS